VCKAAYDKFDAKLFDVQFTDAERDFQDAFYERVRAAEGKYVLEKSELRAIMDMDAAYIARQSEALGGLQNLSRHEFSCFSFAYGDGTFRALASDGMIFLGKQVYGGDVNYYYQGLLHRAYGYSRGQMVQNMMDFNFAQGALKGGMASEYRQMNRSAPFADMGWFHAGGQLKW
jgi:hypothetical protein